MNFKTQFNFQQRKEEADRVLLKFPDRIPIICEKNIGENIPDIDKHKFLVPQELTVGQFLHMIRLRIKLSDKKALFLFINNKLFTNSLRLSDIYINEKNLDGFLYVIYTIENSFG